MSRPNTKLQQQQKESAQAQLSKSIPHPPRPSSLRPNPGFRLSVFPNRAAVLPPPSRGRLYRHTQTPAFLHHDAATIRRIGTTTDSIRSAAAVPAAAAAAVPAAAAAAVPAAAAAAVDDDLAEKQRQQIQQKRRRPSLRLRR
ncbi:hypothetical protein ACFX15_009417 [Malus domestica]